MTGVSSGHGDGREPRGGGRIAEAPVEERLAACVNLLRHHLGLPLAGQGRADPEVKLFIKTRAERCPAIQRVRAHPTRSVR